MNRDNRLLIVILAVLVIGVMLTGVVVLYSATRQQADVEPAQPQEEAAPPTPGNRSADD